jgi:hypothetical protein
MEFVVRLEGQISCDFADFTLTQLKMMPFKVNNDA